ncbi:hypothetical protein [Plantactinospora sp. BB1]|uniref:hypothetical protein n=1 Tax=Plantactinospora sp. BB1 TaxID=2071627 RepID=UPI000D159E1B|nr:hypothetical protein [Plantactinospora sp. BB1]AVT37398.1 hypothetical protein C6W10_14020 [Plantactinospora sp. BB1]
MTTVNSASSGEQIDIGDGVTVPAEVTARGTFSGGYRAELVAAYDADSGRYVTRRVVVEADDGQEVTGERLRELPVARLLRLATQGAVAPYLAQHPADMGKAGPTTETLQQVARVYRLALLSGDAPTQAVAEWLAVPRSTAGRWVTRARDRGLLTVVDPRAGKVES